MAWMRIGGEEYQSADGEKYGANCEGDMIWVREDAVRIAARRRSAGKKVRIIKRKTGGMPFWMVYEAMKS